MDNIKKQLRRLLKTVLRPYANYCGYKFCCALAESFEEDGFYTYMINRMRAQYGDKAVQRVRNLQQAAQQGYNKVGFMVSIREQEGYIRPLLFVQRMDIDGLSGGYPEVLVDSRIHAYSVEGLKNYVGELNDAGIFVQALYDFSLENTPAKLILKAFEREGYELQKNGNSA